MPVSVTSLLAVALAAAVAADAEPGRDWPTPRCNGTRPDPVDRRFNSSAVDALIAQYKPRFLSSTLAQMFENTFPNCLDTTIYHTDGDKDTFVITGDITAMWLRDSTNQLLPYVPLAGKDEGLAAMLCGAVKRQAKQVVTNRYANAFNIEPSSTGHHDDAVLTEPAVSWCDSGTVFENKYELNSLVNVLKLSTAYHNATEDLDCFKASDEWLPAAAAIIDTIRVQQAGTVEDFDHPAYTFSRLTSAATDTLMNTGHGVPARRTGMSKSYFRASDDAVTLPFNVADNAFAVVQLRAIQPLLRLLGRADLATAADKLAQEIDAGIMAFGMVKAGGIASPAEAAAGNVPTVPATPKQPYYVYEADGFGSTYFMDDANIPSLLSLPYLGYTTRDDPAYLETRGRVLSNTTNPWYFEGTAGKGVGGPHVGTGHIWPMSIIMRALTSDDEPEIAECLATLERTTAGTLFMHESFARNNASDFSRPWFSWANSLFAELVIQLARERPHLIFKS